MEFLETKYLYFILLAFSFAYPLAQSFEWRLTYYKKWRHLFLGILVMMLIFIPWDIWFTKISVWWFRSDYISGIKLFNLPLEECLFFIASKSFSTKETKINLKNPPKERMPSWNWDRESETNYTQIRSGPVKTGKAHGFALIVKNRSTISGFRMNSLSGNRSPKWWRSIWFETAPRF